jgi:CDP-6-deoxy-D-xylo-4-hexulose-3-dehydrase
MNPRSLQLRQQILEMVRQYYEVTFPAKEFIPGSSSVPVSGRTFDADDMEMLVDSSLDFWLTTGRFAETFSRQLAKQFGVRHAVLTNSGSSANLLALSCLTSPQLGNKQLLPDDEVITVAAGFPTTVNPILQNQLVPVFVDVTLPSCNLDVSLLEGALSPRTRAIMIAHTLGNPFDLTEVSAFAKKHNLFLIEDCCDALGAEFDGKHVGTFGDLATVSFYPAHHITTGEGGAILTNRPKLKTLLESFRDWGRDCWCDPGKANTCDKRFDWQLGELPEGYDHKYIYSHVGYNLKMTDMQAAIGTSQIQKLPEFIEKRRHNYSFLRERIESCEDFLMLPESHPKANPSWFGFLILVRDHAPFSRRQLIAHLESRNIDTRLLFAGNLTRQPAYDKSTFRVASSLENTDRVMNNALWIGIYPALTEEMLEYTAQTINEFCAQYRIKKPRA